MTRPRLLFYVQHLLGVGHVRRAAAISRAAVRAGLEVRMVLGGEAVPHVDFGGADIIQLPPVRALDMSFKTLVDAHGGPVTQRQWIERREALRSAAEDFAPGALLVEHFPFGRRKFAFELLPLIESLRAQGRPVLCSVRDVLVDKKDAGKSQAVTEIARASFDRILVHGDPAVIPFERTFPAARSIADLLTYTGYVVEEGGGPPAPPGDGEGEVIVSTGGGAVGLPLLAAAVAAANSGALATRDWRLLAGANLPEADFARLAREAGERIKIARARQDFRSLLRRCALSISQAGYNTVMDVLAARCPALLVPFAGGEESEQSLRARELARRGLLSVLAENDLSAPSLAAAAERALNSPQPPSAGLDFDGARRSADLILEAIENAGRRRP
ncbi:MAG: glycosyl transferase family 28 [Bauldia sp.]|nr:MAG: glycosyl transferase family 28 [Bauldia sp.]